MTRMGKCKGNTMKSTSDIKKFFFLRCQNNLAPKFSHKINKSVALLICVPPQGISHLRSTKMSLPKKCFTHLVCLCIKILKNFQFLQCVPNVQWPNNALSLLVLSPRYFPPWTWGTDKQLRVNLWKCGGKWHQILTVQPLISTDVFHTPCCTVMAYVVNSTTWISTNF